MEVLLNGNQHTINNNVTLASMVVDLDLQGKFAIEINGNIVPRSEYRDITLQAGDCIEIVQAIGGG